MRIFLIFREVNMSTQYNKKFEKQLKSNNVIIMCWHGTQKSDKAFVLGARK